MAIEQLMQAVLQASPAKRRELERVIRGEVADKDKETKNREETRLVSISGASRLLSIGRNTAYRLIETGRLDVVELNGSKRVTMRSIHQLLDGERPANEKTAEIIAESKARYAAAKADRAESEAAHEA